MKPITQVFEKKGKQLLSPILIKNIYRTPIDQIEALLQIGVVHEDINYTCEEIFITDNNRKVQDAGKIIEEILIEAESNMNVLYAGERNRYLKELEGFLAQVEADIVLIDGYWTHSKMTCQGFEYGSIKEKLKQDISVGFFSVKELLRQALSVVHSELTECNQTNSTLADKQYEENKNSLKAFMLRNPSILTVENLHILSERLKSFGFVEVVTIDQLQNLLSGRRMMNRINWVKTQESLKYFVDQLTNYTTPNFQKGVVKTIKNKWQVACACFVFRGEVLIPKSLSRLHVPTSKKVKDDIHTIVKDLC